MGFKRVYTENQKYKEFQDTNVGIDYVQWDDGLDGYIYFEESICGNRAEVVYKTLKEAMIEYEESDMYFNAKKCDR